MDEKEEYVYGQPIPQKYRNKLFDWKGGGYDGCFWQPNVGLVDGEGHWRPIFSTGYNGMDQDDWYKRKIKSLKADLGYDERSARMQFEEAVHNAVEKVFGKKWYDVGGFPSEDKRVRALVEEDEKRYSKFVEVRDVYRFGRTHRLDEMFMQVVNGEMQRDDFEEIGLIDDEHLKDTCKLFCERYKGNVGLIAHVLDKMTDIGYSAWCTCTDCGKQFRPYYDTFGCCIDGGAYTGDGGIGVIMKRILCEDCWCNAKCDVCDELDKPNPNKKDGGASDWANYDFLACIINAWLNVCWGCADGFEHEHLYFWDNTLNQRIRTNLGLEYEKIEEDLKEEYGLDGHELYEEIVKTPGGRKKINNIRDLLHEAIVEHFSFYMDDGWFDDRLDTDIPGQLKLPGIE
jgi:hypothetical protein